MVPGGMDVVIFARPTSALREFVERYFKSRWPGCVVEPDVDSKTEVFFHRDAASKAAIDDVGVTPRTADTFVHVLYGEDSFTVVCEVAPSSTAEMVEELRQNIMANWCFFEITQPSPGKGAL